MEIKLTQNKVAVIDQEDFELVNNHKWCAWSPNGDTYYAVTNIKIGGKKTTIKMHRLIMNETDPLLLIDHEDGDGLNNTRINLRRATKAQNNCNKKAKKNSTSKYIGVFVQIKKTKVGFTKAYQAQIKINGVSTYLGLFKNESDAALVYDKKAVEVFGDFARLNFKQR